MASNTRASAIPKAFGPGGAKIATCSFSLVTTALTTVEAQGCSVSRTGVGTYVIQLRPGYKMLNVTTGVEAQSTAQLFIVTGRDLTAGTVTIKQVTAGGGTAVDTITARVDVQIVCRTVS